MAVQPNVLLALQTQLLCNIAAVIPTGDVNFLSGHGDPEGVVDGQVVGQTYLDLDTGATYWFTGSPGGNTGWNG